MIVRGRPTAVIYKRFNRKKWLDPIFNLFRPSRAWRSWQAGQDLVSRGIPTPQNLAYVERRPYGRNRFLRFLAHETYLVTVKEEPAVDLATYVNEIMPALSEGVRRSRIRRLTACAGGAGPLAARAVALAPRPQGGQHPDPDRHDRWRGSAEPDRPGRRATPPSASAEPAGPEPGAAGDQPGVGPRSDPDRRAAVPPPLSAVGALAAERLEGVLAVDRAGDAGQAVAEPPTRPAAVMTGGDA